MSYLLRLLRLLAIVTWVGGFLFFAFVEAPTVFRVMGTTRQFAQIINGSITSLNDLGYVAGFIYLVATFMVWLRASSRFRRLLLIQLVLCVLMVGATLYVQNGIIPAMERDRAAAGGDINAVPATNPARAHFDRLHALSERTEGSALFLGLGIILLMAAEPSGSQQLSR